MICKIGMEIIPKILSAEHYNLAVRLKNDTRILWFMWQKNRRLSTRRRLAMPFM
jgi:hypothetical protein